MEFLSQWISQYGYAGLFVLLVLGIVGLPVPDETLLVFSGYLISKGQLGALLTFASAFAGSVSGMSISYLLGRTLGHAAVERYGRFVHVTPAKVERVHQWFKRVGNWLLSVGYFIPGVRHFTALVAGMSGLEFRIFAPFAFSGAAVWVALFLSLGYWFGENWQSIIVLTHQYTFPAVLLLCAAVGILWLRTARISRGRNIQRRPAEECQPRD
ncbi:MAG: DedA family protein [Bryobacteraceae bacterium]